MQPLVYSGARAVCSINNKVIGAAFVADYHLNTDQIEIEGIDSVFPLEIAPRRIRARMNLRVYRTPDNDPVVGNIAPGDETAQSGSDQQAGFLNAKYITVEIKDLNDKTILYIPKAAVSSRSGSVQVGDFLIETWHIIGIGYQGPRT